jgi:hypothetical protein
MLWLHQLETIARPNAGQFNSAKPYLKNTMRLGA